MAATYHLGDGVIIAGRCGRPELLSGPDRGEYANTTVFVNSAHALASLRIATHRLDRETRSIVLTTDGMQSAVLDPRTGAISQVTEQMASWLDQDTPAAAASGLKGALKRHFSTRTHDDCSVIVARRAVRSDEVLPLACPGCSRWLIAGVKRSGSTARYTCANCSAQYDVIATRGCTPRLEPVMSCAAPVLASLSLSAVAALCGVHDDHRASSLRFSRDAPAVKPMEWPVATAAVLKGQLAMRLREWVDRPVENPVSLILGSIAIRGVASGGRYDVAVGITRDGHREVLGVAPRDPAEGPGAFLEKLRLRGAVAPDVVAVDNDARFRSAAERVWPAASRSEAAPGMTRLTLTNSIQTLEREVTSTLKECRAGEVTNVATDAISVVVMVLGTLHDLSGRWMIGRRYVSLNSAFGSVRHA